jgi:SAM-dependent methyltransferase
MRRQQIEADFDAIAALMPATPALAPTDRWVLAHLPQRRDAVLEIGCGVGELARRIGTTDAIDLSPGMIAEARRRAPERSFTCADLFAWLAARPETYDCILSVATLHHVDFAAALAAIRRSLRPGGRLLVVDLYDRSGIRHLPLNALAFALARLRRREPRALRRAYREHGAHETYLTLHEIRAIAGAALPGARVRPTLFWRYTLLWDKP